jgi:hypothetical protein
MPADIVQRAQALWCGTVTLLWIAWPIACAALAAGFYRLMFVGSTLGAKVLWMAAYAVLLFGAIRLFRRGRGWKKAVALTYAAVLLGGAWLVVRSAGTADLWGMLRYDQRREGAYRAGDRAPDAMLLSLDGHTRVRLSERFGRVPVVLVFGSFTWPPFRRSVERLNRIFSNYRHRAEFLGIYIKDAHPTDEWFMASNHKERDDVCYAQPRTTAERVAIARDFVNRYRFALPLAVDPIENGANDAYAAWPERLVIVGEDGRIAYKGGTGPFQYRPREVETWLANRFAPGQIQRSDGAY